MTGTQSTDPDGPQEAFHIFNKATWGALGKQTKEKHPPKTPKPEDAKTRPETVPTEPQKIHYAQPIPDLHKSDHGECRPIGARRSPNKEVCYNNDSTTSSEGNLNGFNCGTQYTLRSFISIRI